MTSSTNKTSVRFRKQAQQGVNSALRIVLVFSLYTVQSSIQEQLASSLFFERFVLFV